MVLRVETPLGRFRRTTIGICGGNRPDSRCHTINSRKYGRYVRYIIWYNIIKCAGKLFLVRCVWMLFAAKHCPQRSYKLTWFQGNMCIYIYLFLTHRLNADGFDVSAPKTKRCGDDAVSVHIQSPYTIYIHRKYIYSIHIYIMSKIKISK